VAQIRHNSALILSLFHGSPSRSPLPQSGTDHAAATLLPRPPV